MAFLLPLRQEPCFLNCGCMDGYPDQIYWPNTWSESPAEMTDEQYEYYALYHFTHCLFPEGGGNVVYPHWVRRFPMHENDTAALVNWIWPPEILPSTNQVHNPKTLEQLAFQTCAKSVANYVTYRYRDSAFSRNLLRWHIPEAREVIGWLAENYFPKVLNYGLWPSLIYKPDIQIVDFLPKIQRFFTKQWTILSP